MKKVGIVSCDKWAGKISEDILLRDELIRSNVNADIISWEDRSVDYSLYDCLVLRSVWGYQNKLEEFKNWLSKIQGYGLPLYNSPDIILNNIHKDKQFGILDKEFLPHVKTSFVYDEDTALSIVNNDEISVVKPIVSGSGERTILLDGLTQLEKCNLVKNYSDLFLQENNGLMLQPFINGIENGEYACVFINGINTHNMLRFPGVFSSRQKPVYLKSIPKSVENLAYKVSGIDEYKNYLYMRVDIVLNNGQPLIMEVELAEPDLLFKYITDEKVKDSCLKQLSDGIVRRLK